MSGSGENGSGFFIADIFENTTLLSCTAESIQGSVMLPYSPTLTTSLRIVHAVYYLILLVGGVLLNTKVIVLVAKFKKLQTLSFVISLQVVVLDMLLCIMIAIVSVTNVIANRWVFGEHVCSMVGLIILSTTTKRTFLMFIFVMDRFLSVFQPFFYPKHKVKITASLSITSWILSLAIGTTGYAMGCVKFTSVSWLCNVSGNCSKKCSYYIDLLFGAVATPLTVLPIFFYAILYIKAKKIRKSHHRASMGNSTDHFAAEWKATITFFLLFLTVFAMTLPAFTILLIINAVFSQNELPAALYVLEKVASGTVFFLVITDPLVIMRNRDIRNITNKIKIVQKCCPSFK